MEYPRVTNQYWFKKESISTVRPSPDKIKAICEFKRPRTIRELRSFIGLVNFCREFITELSRKAALLFKLLEGESKRSIKAINLVGETEQCFINLKREITEDTLRYQPDMEREFIVITDASDYAISGILSQKDDRGREHIVHSYSKRANVPIWWVKTPFKQIFKKIP
ncbi:hypothetical protein PAPHI01_2649 [Pancytospora philotis]|nr:hypothetical protein PAPHI01_2649 [Pancytospora philotis]